MVLFIRDMTGERWPDRDDSPCDCAAYDPVDGHHTKYEHQKDACRQSWNSPDLCGGCWDCLAQQIAYWRKKREEQEFVDQELARRKAQDDAVRA